MMTLSRVPAMCRRLVLAAGVVGVLPHMAAADDTVPVKSASFHYYFKEQLPLPLNPTKIAVLRSAPDGAAPVLAAVKNAGMVGAVEEFPVHGWWVVTVARDQQSEAGIADWIARLQGDKTFDMVSPVYVGTDGGPVFITPSIMVGFDRDLAPEAAEAILNASGAGVVVERDYSAMPNVFRLQATARNGAAVLDAANEVAMLPEVTFAEPDVVFSGHAVLIPNDTGFANCWGLHNTGQTGGTVDQDMDAAEAWDITQGANAIIVTIIDVGVQNPHPDLNLAAGTDLTNDGPPNDGNPVNTFDEHGTAVAGCVSAIINNNLGTVGVAPACRSSSARTFIAVNAQGGWSSQASWTVDALEFARVNGHRVTNNSNGYGFTSALIEQKYADTRSMNNMVHFAAAGNTGGSPIGYPASIPVVEAVTALNDLGNLASFSSFGAGVDISAPGDDIYTTDRTGAEGYAAGDYATVDGTSFASPYAAGVAALVISQNPARTAAQVEMILHTTAVDRGPVGYDTSYGNGFVNANFALGGGGPAPVAFTEEFLGTVGNSADLDYRTIRFVPNGSGDFYDACVESTSTLPTNPSGGTALTACDDCFNSVVLGGGAMVSLYGTAYGSFFVGSNGYITFTSGSSDLTESLAEHFNQPRVSALYDDLFPTTAGAYSWRQLADRVAITWVNVPEFVVGGSNTLQIELFFNGVVTITHGSVSAPDGIVGLSQGGGIPAGFVETDLSAVGACSDYLTEQFLGGTDSHDLDGRTITFVPNGSADFYGVCIQTAAALATDPAGGTNLTPCDDCTNNVALGGGAMVAFYGTNYGSFFVNSNGSLTFGAGDSTFTETLAGHFLAGRPRIALFWDDLLPSVAGQYSWRQLADRVAITWLNVPEFDFGGSNTIQLEIFLNGSANAGTIRITHLTLSASDAIVGLSRGTGLPAGFFETDFTDAGVCASLTEQFAGGGDSHDLDNMTVTFTPLGTNYSACVESATSLPTDPVGGTALPDFDDVSTPVALTGNAQVHLFGVAYPSFFVSSNGNITFRSGDATFTESLAGHFAQPRISGPWDDFNPLAAGDYSWRQLSDRVAVTWNAVTEFGFINSNTFQIEMFFDGRIRITNLAMAAVDGIVGLSRGAGLTPQFVETDLSALGSCCDCDWNNSGMVNSQDFFDFLEDFFAVPPNADFNMDGMTNSQDFFDFLACFFAGCP